MVGFKIVSKFGVAVLLFLLTVGCAAKGPVQTDVIQHGLFRRAADQPYDEERRIEGEALLARGAKLAVRAGGGTEDSISTAHRGTAHQGDEVAELLEDELRRAGFIVRDRQLMEARLRNIQSMNDYATIADDLDVEYLLVIVEQGTATSQSDDASIIREHEFYAGDWNRLRSVTPVGEQVRAEPHNYQTRYRLQRTWVILDIVRVRDNQRLGRVMGVSTPLDGISVLRSFASPNEGPNNRIVWITAPTGSKRTEFVVRGDIPFTVCGNYDSIDGTWPWAKHVCFDFTSDRLGYSRAMADAIQRALTPPSAE